MTQAQATKPAAKKTTKPAVTNAAPAATVKPAKPVTNKTPAKPKAKSKAALTVVPTTPAKAKPGPVEVKRGPGKPLSQEAMKTRRRVLALFERQLAADPKDVEVTVKDVTKALKIKKVTVSNTIRWAEQSVSIIKRMGYKLKTGPGRKEAFYTIQPQALAKLVKEMAKA